MIYYSAHKWGGLNVLFQLHGSPLPRALPYAILCALMALFFKLQDFGLRDNFSGLFDHPYGHQVFGIVVGFILVFRTNLSYQRFWEGRSMIQQMSTKWGDAISQMVAFDHATSEEKEQVYRDGPAFRERMVHYVSLLHALGLQSLRSDNNLYNLVPAVDRNGNVLHRMVQAENVMEYATEVTSMDVATRSHAPARRVGSKYAFTLRMEQDDIAHEHPIGVLGGVSKKEILDLAPHEHERPFMVMSWIMESLVQRAKIGGLNVPPPVLSRTYQVLSDGMLGLMQCKKIQDTPFPFPYTQLATLVLITFMLSAPIIIVDVVEKTSLAVILSFFTALGYAALNEVARELERPYVAAHTALLFLVLVPAHGQDSVTFAYDPNDLPLAHIQHDFNLRIATLLKSDQDGLREEVVGSASLHQFLSRERQRRASAAHGGL